MATSFGIRHATIISAAFACVALGASGCGDEPASPAERARIAQQTTAPDPGDAPADLPDPGRAEVEYIDGLITLRANAAPLEGILSQLAREARFTLLLGDEPLPDVTLQIERLALTEALPEILDGVEYGAEFADDAVTGQKRVASLWVGEPPDPGTIAESVARNATNKITERIRQRRDEDPRDREERMRQRADRLARMEREQREAIEQLTSRDPSVRADAASEIEPEGEGLNVLLDLVYDDPDPAVRVAAVSQLEDSDTHAAVTGLISALNDDDRTVVLEAIDALEFAGDESVIPSLEPFLDSNDTEVREAAAEAIEFLE